MRTLLVILGLVVPAVALAGTSDRLDKLERRMEAVTELLLDVEQLKRENADLSGQVELLRHELQQLRTQQRELYLDIERRLGGGGAASPPPAAPPAPEPAPPPVAAPAPTPVPTGEPATPAVSPPAGSEKQAYDEAYKLLVPNRRIPEAISALEAFLRQYPDSSYADNAQFWLGEAHYAAQDYGAAVVDFQTLVEKFPQSPKVPDALLKMGYIRYAQGDYGKAREVFEGLIRHYPDTAAARLADQRLSAIPDTGR